MMGLTSSSEREEVPVASPEPEPEPEKEKDTAPAKRGRGRPRKNGSLRALCNNIHVPTQAIRPRGRPKNAVDEYLRRKAINKYIYGITESDMDDMYEEGEEKQTAVTNGIENGAYNPGNGNTGVLVVLKKRGRPRIHPPKVRTPGRGPGRPRKETSPYFQQHNHSVNGNSSSVSSDSSKLGTDFGSVFAPKTRGRPRIHPPKIKVPGRGRGRPRKGSLEPGEVCGFDDGEDFHNDQFSPCENDCIPEEDVKNFKNDVLLNSDNSCSSHSSTSGSIAGVDSIMKNTQGTLPLSPKLTVRGLFRVGSHLPGQRNRPSQVDPQPLHTVQSMPPGSSHGYLGKRSRGRPRIHPAKIKVPGRGRGRPPKSPDQKAQTVKNRLLRKAIERSNLQRKANVVFKSTIETAAHSPGSSDMDRESRLVSQTDSGPVPTLAIRMVGSLQPLYPNIEEPSQFLNAKIANQEQNEHSPVLGNNLTNEGKAEGSTGTLASMSDAPHFVECSPLYSVDTTAKAFIEHSVDGLCLQHVSPAPIVIQPQLESQGVRQTLPVQSQHFQIEGLMSENKAYQKQVKRLVDVVEVKNTAIEHLKGIVESLGVQVSQFVLDALNATAVKDEPNRDESSQMEASKPEVTGINRSGLVSSE